MKAWLGTEQFHLVSDRKDAWEMPEHKARAVMQDANLHHPERTWELVPVGRDLFIVEGTQELTSLLAPLRAFLSPPVPFVLLLSPCRALVAAMELSKVFRYEVRVFASWLRADSAAR